MGSNAEPATTGRGRGALAAWLLASLYYFYQYALRSSPGAMMPQLSESFGLSVLGTASLVSLFYYSYALCNLAAGPSLDALGVRAVIPVAALITAIGAGLFGTGSLTAAYAGRLLQGAGGTFAIVGAVCIASENFAPSRAATLIGATQMFGMAGGAVGQFLAGPLLARGTAWGSFWVAMGGVGLFVAAALFVFLPKQARKRRTETSVRPYARALAVVFRNPQSILCGIIAGLLFIPTTIFDMTWGVRFLQQAHGLEYGDAVMRSATVPIGWMIGCPLLGFVSDRLGRRKPVIIAGGCVLMGCLAWILYGRTSVFPPYALALLFGIASGAAMLPYTVIKEANPPNLTGTATGVINFLNLAFTAILGPVFGWLLQRLSTGAAPGLSHYQMTFRPLLYGVAFALLLTFALKETGRAAEQIPIKAREAA